MSAKKSLSAVEWIDEQRHRFFELQIKPHLTGLNFSIAALIALVTGGFAVLIIIMLLVGTNFNLLGAVE
jgi:hypothetical protein